jgi:hypothetical protein
LGQRLSAPELALLYVVLSLRHFRLEICRSLSLGGSLRRPFSPTFPAGDLPVFIPWRVSASSFLSDISGWGSAGLYPLAGGGRGIWRGDFGGALLLDRRGPRISF